jgi:hypothetical protein
MILGQLKNKYGFDMWVSAPAIDAPSALVMAAYSIRICSRTAFQRTKRRAPRRAHKVMERKQTMTDAKFTRRSFAATAATSLAAIGLLGATVKSADAYQGNMERAVGSLHEALQSLQESTPNKGGHRERAINLIQQAVAETQAGIDFANQHGGGGR